MKLDMKWTRFGLASSIWLASVTGASAGDSTISGNTENATCPDPLTWTLLGLFGPVTTAPAGFQPIPRSQVFVPAAQRVGLSQKRIVVFGDLYAMDQDTPPLVNNELRNLFASADLVLGNIEAPITNTSSGALDLSSSQTFNFHANVAYVKSAMAQYCMDPDKTVFTVANNHAGDGHHWSDTLANSPSLGADIVGVDRTGDSLPAVTVKNVGDLRVGVVGWTHVQNNPPATDWLGNIIYPSWQASLDVTRRTDWKLRKEVMGIELLIGMPHWDCQFFWFPHTYTMNTMQQLHDQGFDMIAGSHPSTLQPGTLFAGNQLAMYSMGILTNAINTGTNNMITVMEIIVDGTGRTLEYTLHPYVMHKVAAPDTANLLGFNFCGLRPVYDTYRATSWKIITLDQLAQGSSQDQKDYAAFIQQLNATFPN